MSERIPNLFIIGAPKCGTTSLTAYLMAHPHIFISQPKEPHFFNSDHRYRNVKDWDIYLSLFDEAPHNASILGEASVWYLYSDEAIPRIYDVQRESRFVVMLRNPIDMVPSLHGQLFYHGREDCEDVERAWMLQETRKRGHNLPKHCIEPSHLQYKEVCSLGTLLKKAQDRIPRDRLLTILLDDLRKDPKKEYLRVLEFLGVPDDRRTEFSALNKNKVVRSVFLQRRLNSMRRWISPSGIQMNTGLYNWLKTANTKIMERQPLREEFRKELIDVFEDDVKMLERMLQRDLDSWLN